MPSSSSSSSLLSKKKFVERRPISLNSLTTFSQYLLIIFFTKFVSASFDVTPSNDELESQTTSSSTSTSYPYDYLCNNGTKFACVCYRADDSLTPFYPLCTVFFGQKSLPVVKVALNATDLTNQIITNHGYENYEHYFKRRVVAKLLSRYCTNSTNECLGTVLPVSASNVIVLKIGCGAQRLSVIYYVVAQTSQQKFLTAENTMNPTTIIRIINATIDRKPALLGHAKLVEHERDYITIDGTTGGDQQRPIDVDTTSKSPTDEEEPDYFVRNMAFFIVIIVLGIIVGIIYIIAIIKAISDRTKQSKRMKDHADKQEPPQNYGATNNSSTEPTPFFNATIVTADEKNTKVTSSCSDLNAPPLPPKVTLSTSTSFTRVVVNHPPPPPKRQPPLIIPPHLSFTSAKKPRKTTSTENLIAATKENEDHVKKSKTVHEIATYDNELPLEIDKEETPTVDVEDEYQMHKIPTVVYENQPEIRIQSVSDEDLGENKEDVDSDDLRAAQLLTTSQTEENLLHSDASSLNEFSTESDDSDDVLSEQNLQPYADYVTLKESNWSLNRANEEEKF